VGAATEKARVASAVCVRGTVNSGASEDRSNLVGGPCKMLWGRPLLPWQRNFGKCGQFFHKIAYKSACIPDRPGMFGPTTGADQGSRSLAPWQRHWETWKGARLCSLACDEFVAVQSANVFYHSIRTMHYIQNITVTTFTGLYHFPNMTHNATDDKAI